MAKTRRPQHPLSVPLWARPRRGLRTPAALRPPAPVVHCEYSSTPAALRPPAPVALLPAHASSALARVPACPLMPPTSLLTRQPALPTGAAATAKSTAAWRHVTERTVAGAA